MMSVDEIFAEDRNSPPAERSLPWEESRGGVTVVVEPKPHWAEDMRAFRLDAREYCRHETLRSVELQRFLWRHMIIYKNA